MTDGSAYWNRIAAVRNPLRCWVRMAATSFPGEPRWGQLLLVPVDGYLEGPGGPVRLREVEWVELSTQTVKGGLAGRPLEFIDITAELTAALRTLPITWELREARWSIGRIFEDRPVQVVRIVNPFGPSAPV